MKCKLDCGREHGLSRKISKNGSYNKNSNYSLNGASAVVSLRE